MAMKSVGFGQPAAGEAGSTDAPQRPLLLLAGLWLIYFSFGVIAAGLAPLIGPIARDLGIGNTQMGLILGAWPLVYIASAIPCGLALDRFSARWVLMLATVILGASSFSRGLAQDGHQLFLAVALFGVAGPMVSVGLPKLASQWFDGPAKGMAIGILMTAPALGNAAALALTEPVLMPLLNHDWRLVLQVEGAFAMLVGLVWAALASGTGGHMTGARAKDARLPFGSAMAMLRDGGVVAIMVLGLGIFALNHGMNNWLPAILQQKGYTPSAAGYWSTMPVVVGIVASLLVPRLARRGRRVLVMALLALAAAVAMPLLVSGSQMGVAAALILLGVARGSMVAVAMLMLLEAPGVPRERFGLAGGMFFIAAEIGGVSGAATVGWLSDISGSFALPLHVLGVLALTMAILTVVSRRSVDPARRAVVATP